MRHLKNVTIILFMGLVTLLAGCGSELTAGGIGLASGLTASKMFAGMQADLAEREQDLIERYNASLETGAKSEVLDRIESDIDNTALLRQGAQAAKDVVGVIAESRGGQATTYGAIAAIIASLGYNVYQKYTGGVMKKTTKAIVKGVEAADKQQKSNPANPIKTAIGKEMVAAGIFDQGNQLVDRLKIAR